MDRLYDAVVREHFRENRQMLFLMGPRQVGKTTTALASATAIGASTYFSWDNPDHRRTLLAGPQAIAAALELDRLREDVPVCVLDEIHKYGKWKGLLKGLFDSYGDRAQFLVTGSARLDVFKAGGDSLMGRYFPYRMHPLSVAELVSTELPEDEFIRPPTPVDEEQFQALMNHGGYPEPFLKDSDRFWRRWSATRTQQLMKEDLRDLTQVRELGQVETLAELVAHRIGQLVSYSSLSRDIGASVDSIRRWIRTLESLYYCFSVRPWHVNVTRSLRKEPKYFLWDWSQVKDPGARAENMVASALLKAVHVWSDRGQGSFALHFIRDKEKREVDFVVVRDGAPWFLVEVKQSGRASLSPHLHRFKEQTGARHAFQVAMDAPYVDRDCFAETEPVIVPARTFLSQLV